MVPLSRPRDGVGGRPDAECEREHGCEALALWLRIRVAESGEAEELIAAPKRKALRLAVFGSTTRSR